MLRRSKPVHSSGTPCGCQVLQAKRWGTLIRISSDAFEVLFVYAILRVIMVLSEELAIFEEVSHFITRVYKRFCSFQPLAEEHKESSNEPGGCTGKGSPTWYLTQSY